jgi:putative ubiquitin-RnfH superfamily antitoxin RatB of RatAB toxin-antitoxin module
MTETLQTIRVVFAVDATTIWDQSIECPPQSSIEQVILQSGLMQAHPSFDFEHASFGVFGKRQSGDFVLQDGDRLEIFRPLTFDPKTSRRRRALHRQKTRNIKKKVPINDLTQ